MSRVESRVEPVIRLTTSARGEAARLHSWIKDLTKIGPFHVPLRVAGLDIVRVARATGRGLVLCSTHVPLFDLMLPALIDAGHRPDFIVSDDESSTGGGYQVPASSEILPIAKAGPKAFLPLRSALRNGGVVISLLDWNVDSPIYDTILRLAGKLSSPVVLWSTKLGTDGVIEVTFEALPYPLCESEEAIRANVAVVESYRSAWRTSVGLELLAHNATKTPF